MPVIRALVLHQLEWGYADGEIARGLRSLEEQVGGAALSALTDVPTAARLPPRVCRGAQYPPLDKVTDCCPRRRCTAAAADGAAPLLVEAVACCAGAR